MTLLPETMRAWTYTSAIPTLESNLHLNHSAPLPTPTPSQHLVRVLAVSLNPVDYKPAEAPLIGRLLTRKPITPGSDIAARIVTPADDSHLAPGDLVYGTASTNPLAGGGLADYIVAPASTISAMPTNLSPLLAAGLPVAAITAYGSIVPYLKSKKPGARVFLNGGSGGVGTFGIQIAKASGAHVTVSCSTQNIELCRTLGADEVLDYTVRPLLDQLRDTVTTSGQPFDHVVDNVFSDPQLYWQAHTYTTAEASFVEVASGPSIAFLKFAIGALLWPSALGVGRRKFVVHVAHVTTETLEDVGKLVATGKVKTVADRVFTMEEIKEAFQRLKTGRVKAKVIVNITRDKE